MGLVPHHLSYSHLHLLACPFAAFLKYEAALESPTTPWLALGTALHTSLERTHKEGTFSLQKAVGIFKHDYNQTIVDKDVFVGYPLLKKLEKEGIEMLELYNAQIESGKVGQFPLAMEKEFELAIAGTKLVGKIDRIDYDESDGEYEVSDYKSGKAKPEAFDLRHNLQLTAYAWAVLEIYGKLPKKLFWWHLRTGERLETVRTMEDIEDLKRMIKNAVFMKQNDIRHRIFHDGVCNYCDFRGAICEDRDLEANILKGMGNVA